MNKLVVTGYGCWGALGAYRGVQEYNKKFNRDFKHYLKYPDTKKPEYYYLSCLGFSLLASLGYIIPPFLLFNAGLEIYNIERALRGIKDEEEN